MFTCQPMSRLSTEGGNGVGLSYPDMAMKPLVDCRKLKT